MASSAFASEVAGVTDSNSDGTDRQTIITRYARRGVRIIPRREPNNPDDPNAIGLWIGTRKWFILPAKAQIGYVNAVDADRLSSHMDDGGGLRIRVTQITEAGVLKLGVKVRIEMTGKGTR